MQNLSLSKTFNCTLIVALRRQLKSYKAIIGSIGSRTCVPRSIDVLGMLCRRPSEHIIRLRPVLSRSHLHGQRVVHVASTAIVCHNTQAVTSDNKNVARTVQTAVISSGDRQRPVIV